MPTFFDNWLRQCLEYRGDDPAMLARCEATAHEFLRISRQARLQSWIARHAATRGRSILPPIALIHSQGVSQVLEWKGLPLFKSAFDLAIYQQLLAEQRPRHIVEIGSGSGASAVWLRDMATALYEGVEVVSADIAPPRIAAEGVRFLQCDCREAGGLAHVLGAIERKGPVLVIEDAHQGVPLVLEQVCAWLRSADYLIVEDSQGKQDDIGRSPLATTGDFAVDTRYVDLFGTNVTSCIDSIFVKTGADAS